MLQHPISIHFLYKYTYRALGFSRYALCMSK